MTGAKLSMKTDKISRNDLNDILSDWNRNFGHEFPVSEEHINSSLFDAEDYDPDASFCMRDDSGSVKALIAVKHSMNQELYPDAAWITLMYTDEGLRDKGYGSQLYHMAEKALVQEGVHKLYIGQDFSCFFSGIPSPYDEKEEFFRKLGFTLNADRHSDLEADIVDNRLIDDFDVSGFEDEFKTETLRECDDADMLAFLGSSEGIPGRWAYEMKGFLDAGGDRSNVVALKDRTEAIKGFCMLTVCPDGSGGLGPIGIAKDIRGRHVGDYILRQSLCQLRSIGGRKITIDWTILEKYYGQFGFEPVRIYRAGYKEF